MIGGSIRTRSRLVARAGLIPVAAFAVHQLRFLLAFGGRRRRRAQGDRPLLFPLRGPLDHARGRPLRRCVSVVTRPGGIGSPGSVEPAALVPEAVARMCCLPARDLLHPRDPGGPFRNGASHGHRGDLRFRRSMVDPKRDWRRTRSRSRHVRGELDARRGQSQALWVRGTPGSQNSGRLTAARGRADSDSTARRWLV